MIVWHGSDHLVERPVFGGGKKNNDYGRGFYTTENVELAKEWACARGKNGFANGYELDLTGLRVLNLNGGDYEVLNWLAILTRYRSYWQNGSIAQQAKNYLQEHFFVDPEEYDIIIGNRADDSYFTFAQDFISGVISLRQLAEAMTLGKLGEQIVLKSERSFGQLRFLRAEAAEGEIYYDKKAVRDREAKCRYRESRASADLAGEIYMIDIMREGMTHGDPRLR